MKHRFSPYSLQYVLFPISTLYGNNRSVTEPAPILFLTKIQQRTDISSFDEQNSAYSEHINNAYVACFVSHHRCFQVTLIAMHSSVIWL